MMALPSFICAPASDTISRVLFICLLSDECLARLDQLQAFFPRTMPGQDRHWCLYGASTTSTKAEIRAANLASGKWVSVESGGFKSGGFVTHEKRLENFFSSRKKRSLESTRLADRLFAPDVPNRTRQRVPAFVLPSLHSVVRQDFPG
jgi:hypothetical protein